MTDDERLAELFRTAASDAAAPPPRFDHADVVAASRRITARRRTALVGGLGVLAAVGVVGVLALPGGPADRDQPTSAAAPMISPEDGRGSGSAGEASGSRQESDSAAGAPAVAPQYAAPLGPAGGECADLQDPALRALVDEALPELTSAPPAPTPDICIAGGVRRVSVQLGDGAGEGVLLVAYSPPSVAVDAVSGALVATTASGGTVLVAASSTDPAAPVPLEDRLPALLEHLVPRL